MFSFIVSFGFFGKIFLKYVIQIHIPKPDPDPGDRIRKVGLNHVNLQKVLWVITYRYLIVSKK